MWGFRSSFILTNANSHYRVFSLAAPVPRSLLPHKQLPRTLLRQVRLLPTAPRLRPVESYPTILKKCLSLVTCAMVERRAKSDGARREKSGIQRWAR